MRTNHIVRTPLGRPVVSVRQYLANRHPSARKVHQLAEVLVELEDGTFTFETLPVELLSIEVTR